MKPERKKQVGQTPGKWYIVSKIVQTYCEKKYFIWKKLKGQNIFRNPIRS